MAKEILCAYGIDVDAVAGWLGSYGGENSPDDISRGLFAGEVGTPRLLQLFERHGLKTPADWLDALATLLLPAPLSHSGRALCEQQSPDRAHMTRQLLSLTEAQLG